ncbi:MAG TPA: alpha/beta hydrolase [Phycisphaerae bacterium]|jgi:acetyl esterase/lipase
MMMRLQLMALAAAVLAAGIAVMGAAPAAPASGAPAGDLPSVTGPTGVPRMKLWKVTPGVVAGADADANPTEPTIDVYLPPPEKATGTAVMIFPGGGYTNLSMTNEGSDEAKFFLSHDVAAFVVRYRHAPRYHYPTPILDGQRAIRVVRSMAATYHLDANKIGVLGFSAGGHMAASMSTMFDNGPKPEAPDAIDALSARPDFSILLYPVIDMSDDTVVHKGSRTALTQDDKSLYELLSPQKHVTKDTPPAFIVQGTNDNTVPVMNSLLYYQALLKVKVPVEMHILENGPHGFGMGTGRNGDDEMKSWPDQAIRWMTRHKLLSK